MSINGKIFLSGGGNYKETYNFDRIFFKNSGEKILYLPLGLKRSFPGYDGCIEWFKEVIKKHKQEKKIETWVDLKNKRNLINIKKFDAVYIGGASDTFRLHSLLKKYRIFKKLEKFLDSGGVIYGGSGGATVLGRSINYDQENKKLEIISDYSANLCFGYSVFTHLNFRNIDDLEGVKFGNLLALPEHGGFILDRNSRLLTYIGRGEGLIISSNSIKKIKNKKFISIN